MKHFRMTMTMVAMAALALTFSSCKNQSANTDKTGPEYTSAWVCPMHCEGSGADEAGKCPVCGMDLVKNEAHEMHQGKEDDHAGHSHEGDAHEHAAKFACPMHPEITGVEGDKCSICGMDLTPTGEDGHESHDH